MRDELILNNLKLIYIVLKQMGIYHLRDEYYDLGLIGLVKAADTYDSKQGYTFSAYASRCIFNEISQNIRRESSNKRKANSNTISLETVLIDDGKEVTLLDTIPSNYDLEEDILKKEQKELLRKALPKLRDSERELLVSYYCMEGKAKQKVLAEKIGVTQASISRKLKRIINKLKKIINY